MNFFLKLYRNIWNPVLVAIHQFLSISFFWEGGGDGGGWRRALLGFGGVGEKRGGEELK